MRYYSIMRPIGPGTYPKAEAVTEIVNFDERRKVEGVSLPAWGYVEYSEPLTDREAEDYELIAA